ncbi:uncharacterized protein LOC105921256 [Fundulus heteroclitus]|uniref:uncharacterized protein LOC105921256 n=1 Tax=Fundulus heteroclitus TaxID=8078 RepID=UPI00165B6E5A|nr:uncharacterized protein LOC105921256 [Fundulus heteroclitus]
MEMTLILAGMGGSGQRKLSLIPPENEGYNGTLLKSVTGGGKNLIYIVPLQEKLDMSPLPLDAKEFKGMPKASCKVCNATMPLQVLAVHVKTCVDLRSSGEEFEIPNTSHHEISADGGTPVASTLRTNNTKILETSEGTPMYVKRNIHWTFYRSMPAVLDRVLRKHLDQTRFTNQPDVEKKSLDDVIKEITNAVSTDGVTFDIAVSRKNMLERGIAQWQRQKKTSPTNPLKVTFIGEVGIDTGALRKEFLTEMVSGIERRFFLKGVNGCVPTYSLSDLDKGHFRTVGEIMVVSLAQAGPAPNFLMPWCYRFLCTGSPDFESMGRNDVVDEYFIDLISKVESANETTLLDITEDILNCGYTGIILLDKKEEMMRSVVLHANLRLLPILQQLRKGLRLYGLSDIMSTYPDTCQPLFVPGVEMKADADFIISVCQAEFSEKGSNKEQSEVDLMNHFQDFLQELEQGESSLSSENGSSLSPSAFLQWITGQAHIPVLQEERKNFQVNVQFLHQCESQ